MDFGLLVHSSASIESLQEEASTATAAARAGTGSGVPSAGSSELVLQSNCDAGELRFWRVQTGTRIESASSVRDVDWFSFSCTLGWPVQVADMCEYYVSQFMCSL